MREPNSIRAAAALACIIIQSNQNSMYGGQSINAWDYSLAPYVRKSFNKHLAKNVERLNPGLPIPNFKYKEEKDRKDKGEYNAAYQFACQDTEEETKQAMEAAIANFNTLNSRAGSQTPFSSLNFGTDTSPEGRLIIKETLNAVNDGLGNGETCIFPITIMKLKSGINYNPDDPNYDLFKYACKVSAKRLFPNFVSLNAPYNAQYYKEGDYNTEVAVMGCADGDELVSYSYNNIKYCESFKRMWNRIALNKEIFNEEISAYIKPDNVKIWDGDNGYVDVKTIIKNPDNGNWIRVTFNNGRSILVTDDHPLYTENKGRIFTSDLEIGDTIRTYWNLPIEEDNHSSITESGAYILGLILVDGCYDKQLTVTLDTKTEQDVSARFINCVRDVWDKECTVTHFDRDKKGIYDSISVNGGYTDGISSILIETFGGLQKNNRKIPDVIFRAPRNIKIAFMAGMIDGDGHISYKSKVQIGSVNKELALQQLALAQSLGIPAKIYLNHYNSSDKDKIRYRVEYSMTEEIAEYLGSSKKSSGQWNGKISETKTPEVIAVKNIEFLGFLNKDSYDVETATDHFTLSFINSGNCRTRTMGNVCGPEVSGSRGNFAFVTLNLPMLALMADRNIDKFWKLYDKYIYLSKEYLEWRYDIIKKKHVYNFPFLMTEGVWLDSEKLKAEDTIESVLKHASLSIGFCGLAECLIALTGKHHGESQEAQKLGLKIIQHLRNLTDSWAEEEHRNWSCFSTPAESTAGSFVKAIQKKYGKLKGISDKEYLTNSFHQPVYYKSSAKHKIDIEAPYHSICNAGCISYIEYPGDPLQNIVAFEKLVRMMTDANMNYYSINHTIDRDPICGYTGIIANECPHCHRREDGKYKAKIKKYNNND